MKKSPGRVEIIREPRTGGAFAAEADVDVERLLGAKTMVSEYQIQDSDKLKKFSVKSILYIKRKYEEYKLNSLDKSKRFVNWLSTEVVDRLIENEKRLKTENSALLTRTRIFELSDDAILRMIARKVRPISVHEYVQMVVESVPKLRATNSDYTVMETKGYDVNLHAPVNKLLEDFKDVDYLFRLAATADELEQLPKNQWGTKEDPGGLRVLLSRFGEYQANFVRLVTEKKLKEFRTLEEALEAIGNVNDLICNDAVKLRRADTKLKPLEKNWLELLSGSTVSSSAISTKPLQTSHTSPRPSTSTRSEPWKSKSQVNFHLTDGSSIMDHEDTPVSGPEPDLMLRTNVDLEHEEEEHDEEEEDAKLIQEIDQLMAFSPVTKSTSNYPKRSTSVQQTPFLPVVPADPSSKDKKPCFKLLQHGKCEAGHMCQYSHAKADLQAYVVNAQAYLRSLPCMQP
jgi:hypothetical protein